MAPADVARRQQFRDRIGTYNSLLENACQAYGSRCAWDGGAVFRARFSLAELASVDYFHPNTSGQSRLAEVTYPATFSWGS
jgi:hypothetical protein